MNRNINVHVQQHHLFYYTCIKARLLSIHYYNSPQGEKMLAS